MKLCKDCRWCSGWSFGAWLALKDAYEIAKCQRPDGIDLVSGKQRKTGLRFCENVRKNTEGCGPDAKYFQPRNNRNQQVTS